MSSATDISVNGVILAGGRGTRVGGQDKGLLDYRGRVLIEHVIDRFAPQVDALCINANRNLESYRELGFPVITDALPDYPGPLAGMLAGLDHAVSEYVAFVPCDAPDLPTDLVARLLEALQSSGHRVAVAYDGNRMQCLHVLLHRSCRDALQAYLDAGDRKVELWLQQVQAIAVDFQEQAASFYNLNTPDHLES